jgi:glutamate transport system substrate-binding protein
MPARVGDFDIMRTRRRLSFAVLMTAALLTVSACTHVPTGPDKGNEPAPTFAPKTTMKRLAKEGSITIGTSFDNYLFGSLGADGEPQGFDIEIGKLIAHGLGIEPDGIVWKEVTPENRESMLKEKEVDIVIDTYTITDARKATIGFSGPYYRAAQSVLVPGDERSITSEKSLAGKAVCSVQGSTSADRIAALKAVPVLKPAITDCLAAVEAGQAEAVVADNVLAAGALAAGAGADFTVVGQPFSVSYYGIGVRKKDDLFRDFMNVTLEESYTDGSYEAAWDRSAGTVLGFNPPPKVKR